MFWRPDQRPVGNFLEPAIFHFGAADHPHQPDAAARPISGDGHDRLARHQVGRNSDNHPKRQPQVEQHVVDQRTQENRNHREPDQLTSAVAGLRGVMDPVVGWSTPSGASSRPASANRTRTSAATYFAYSDSSSRTVVPLVHHGSSRHLSPTTANGISATSGIACDSSTIARGM